MDLYHRLVSDMFEKKNGIENDLKLTKISLFFTMAMNCSDKGLALGLIYDMSVDVLSFCY